MKENWIVNKLPSPTWNWLKVNEAAFPWDQEAETVLEPVSLTLAGKGTSRLDRVSGETEYTKRAMDLTAPAGTEGIWYQLLDGRGNQAVTTKLTLAENARVRLVQLLKAPADRSLYSRVEVSCAENARFSLTQILLGDGDVYADIAVTLGGDGSVFEADLGYLGRNTQTLDMNVAVDHFGKNTESRIDTSGALMDGAKKIFRGTIDFKTGSAGSVGNEKETVLLLGDDVVNKTVPLILCAEENVVGNHGATIGQLDDATVFYFESRGIEKALAEHILARAAIEALARSIENTEMSQEILTNLGEELGDDDEEL